MGALPKSPESPILHPRFKDGAPMLFAGLSQRYTEETRHRIAEQWARFVPLIAAIGNRVGNETFGAVSFRDDGFDYLSGVWVSGASALPAGIDTLAFPARRYAVFAHDGHVSGVVQTMNRIWSEWLSGSGLETDGAPQIVEIYGDRFNPTTGNGGFDIWVAVRDGHRPRISQ